MFSIQVTGLNKTYADGKKALDNINLEIKKGEIFALLGPNGAGKTTLISSICGLVQPTHGQILVGGYNALTEFRQARDLIGLVPQELTTDAFESVWNTVSFSRALFGKAKNDAYIEQLLKNLSLWDKKDNALRTLSGGMKRRVMIAKALSHEPQILFLDEPTAGVDVELRKSMWAQVNELRKSGVTIILTTHYIEEAEEMADRVGVIHQGKIVLIEETRSLMEKLGQKKMFIELNEALTQLPARLQKYPVKLCQQDCALELDYDTRKQAVSLNDFFDDLRAEGLHIKDLQTKQSSLEQIFIQLVQS